MAAVAPADERQMISERIAPGMLPRVLNSADMTIIFVAIVLFIVNASAIQRAGPSAYTFWIVGFLAFLIPGALVTAQLGLMFPQEGSLYVWTQKALGPFFGFFAGFCAWWPGILVMAATGDAVVTIWQFIDTGGLPKGWEQGLVILAVLWFSAGISMLRLRMTQNYANVAVVFYGAAIFVIGLAGILWLIGDGHSATGGFGSLHNWLPHSSTWTLFGLVILALLGIEVPLNMGVEIVHMRAIKRYLFWGSIVVMVGYLWATFGTMMNLPASQSTGGLSDIFVAVQHAFWGSHAWAVIIALVALWFFVSNTVVYNYSFSRLLFVSGLERRMPTAMGHEQDLLDAPGRGHRDLVHLDGPLVRRHLPREARVPTEVRGGARGARLGALRERARRDRGIDRRHRGDLLHPMGHAVDDAQLARVARDHRDRVRARRDRHLRDQRVHAPT
jgi:amino acid transporter